MVAAGWVVVVEGTKVAVGLGFTAALTPNERLMTTAATIGAVTIKLLAKDPSGMFNLRCALKNELTQGRPGPPPQIR